MWRRLVAVTLVAAVCALPGAAQDSPPSAGAPAPTDTKAPPRAVGAYVFHLVVSADGRRVAASSAHSVFVWDVGSATPLLRFRDDSPFMKYQDIGLSKDGSLLVTLELRAADHEHEAKVWSVARSSTAVATFGPERAREDGKTGKWPIVAATFDAAGHGLVLYRNLVGISVVSPEADERGRAWFEPPVPAIESLEDRRRIESWPDHVDRVSFSPDDKSFAISVTNGVRVYSWPAREMLFTAYNGADYGYCAEFGGGGSLILATVRRPTGERDGPADDVTIAFDGQGRRLWVRPRAELLALSRASPPCDAVLRTKLGGVELVDALTGKVRRPFPDAGLGTVTAAVFSPDGRYLWVARREAGDVLRYEVRPPGEK